MAYVFSVEQVSRTEPGWCTSGGTGPETMYGKKVPLKVLGGWRESRGGMGAAEAVRDVGGVGRVEVVVK